MIKNTYYSLLSFTLKIVNNIFIFSLLARVYSVEIFGFVGLALSVSVLVASFIDFGYRIKIVRDIAGDEVQNEIEYFSRIIVLKVFLCIVIAPIYLIWASKLQSNSSDFLVLVFFFFGAIFLSFSNTAIAYFHSISSFQVETKAMLIYTIVFLPSVLLSIGSKQIVIISIGFMLGNLLMLFWLNYLFQSRIQLKMSSIFTECNPYRMWREVVRVFPFTIHVLASVLLITVDVLFVEIFCSRFELGLYQGFQKILMGVSLISSILTTSLLPTLSRKISIDDDTIDHTIGKMTLGISFIGIVLAVIVFFGLYPIVNILFGTEFLILTDYKIALSIVIIAKYIAVIPGIIITASGHQATRTITVVIVLILSCLGYLYFLPKFKLDAAIFLMVFSQVGISLTFCSLAYFFVKKNRSNLKGVQNAK